MGRKKMSQNEFLDKARNILGDNYLFNKTVYKDSHSKVVITCKQHGDFEERPCDVLYHESGCPKCRNEKIRRTKSLTTQQYIERAKKIQGYKYDYSLVNYVNSRTKITLVCREHGPFEILPYYFLSGHGCPECSSGTSPERYPSSEGS
jgi:Zn finger protein HypA/HybF involved in hydrogenase expression